MLSSQILPTSTWVLFTAGILQLHEGQLWTIPWGKVCQLKQLLTDMVSGGSGLRSLLPIVALMPGRQLHRNLSTHPHPAYSHGEERDQAGTSTASPETVGKCVKDQGWFSKDRFEVGTKCKRAQLVPISLQGSKRRVICHCVPEETEAQRGEALRSRYL